MSSLSLKHIFSLFIFLSIVTLMGYKCELHACMNIQGDVPMKDLNGNNSLNKIGPTNRNFSKKKDKKKNKKNGKKKKKVKQRDQPSSQTPKADTPHPRPQKEFIYLQSTFGYGLFNEFLSLLGALYYYDKEHYAGVKVDFAQSGTYYDPSRGSNWWEYYFEPLFVGNPDNTISFLTANGNLEVGFDRIAEFNINREEASILIKKYIHLKPHLLEKIKNFVKTHFKEKYMIGVHYRGTDKFLVEAPYISYDEVATNIDRFIKKAKNEYQIFVASDEQQFIEFMLERYPQKVIYYEEATRSVTTLPIHLSYPDPYKNGEDAVMDCLLLSKCDVLIKTSSNLSLCSAYFNPNIPMIHLSVRPWHAPLE